MSKWFVSQGIKNYLTKDNPIPVNGVYPVELSQVYGANRCSFDTVPDASVT